MTNETILTQIVNRKRIDLSDQKKREPLHVLKSKPSQRDPIANLSGALMGDRIRVIAEVKKASPSKGILNSDLDPSLLS